MTGAARPHPITLCLHAHLRRLVPDCPPSGELELTPRPAESLGALLDRLGVPEPEIYALVCHGQRLHRADPPPAGPARIEVLPVIAGG